MRKTTFSLLCSLIYFGLAIFAVRQMNSDGQNSHHLAQFLAVCAFVDVFAIALIAQPPVRHRGLVTPVFLRRAAKYMRFVSAVLTLPCIVYWGTGEVLLHPSGELQHWTKSVITFSQVKVQLEGEGAARAYLGRAAHASGRVGEGFERKGQLQEAYEYYSSYAELSHAQWPSSYRPDARGTAVLARILDKMGRYEEADRQYARAEEEVLALTKDQRIKIISDGRLLRLLNGVSEKSPLHSFVSNLAVNDSSCALKIGTSFTKIDQRPILLDWREPNDMSAGVAYSGEHMRYLLSEIKMRNVPPSERAHIHTVEEFDFGKPAFSLTYLDPQSFQTYLRRCHVIMPTKTYARLKELSEMK